MEKHLFVKQETLKITIQFESFFYIHPRHECRSLNVIYGMGFKNVVTEWDSKDWSLGEEMKASERIPEPADSG